MVINLNGAWNACGSGLKKPIAATVPGCIHTDLLKAGVIDDPYFRDNENAVQWIGETDWTYSRRFNVDSAFLRHHRVVLCCTGLDTLATVRMNGRIAGTADNMFRAWEFDVKRLLHPGTNHIEIAFSSTLPYINSRLRQRDAPGWLTVKGSSYVRKEQCNYGWDWGPKLITCGIWRDISIRAFDTARIADVHITQDHSTKNTVRLHVAVEAELFRQAKLDCTAVVTRGSTVVGEKRAAFRGRRAGLRFEIKNPQLWWPAGMGEQPLYRVSVTLTDAHGKPVDSTVRRIGLRTLRLEQKDDAWGRSFAFVVNGVPFFAKGANWIPADTFVTRLRRGDYARLIGDARAAHINMLRVWGGGIYEQDWFYDICDELGICVWQDFMFACSSYPAFDKEWMTNVKEEIIQNVRRLRHHPCIALWCGNNELEQGILGPQWDDRHMGLEDYARLFDTLIPQITASLDPQRDYWPSSPHTPVGDRFNGNIRESGDAHVWEVWHGQRKFTDYHLWIPRFVSEFGFQSFPEPRTVASYTRAGDRNVTSYVMEHHQRSGIGNTTIMRSMLDWFRLPTSFEMTLWLSQILQALGVGIGVEHWRRAMGRCMGTLYWQLNDCWPVASWASIDSFGRWKALHYATKRFYAPILVSSPGPSEDGAVEIHVTSDHASTRHTTLHWTLTDIAGKKISDGSRKLIVRPRSSRRVATLSFKEYIEEHGRRNLLLWLELTDEGRMLSRKTVLFAPPKHIDFQQPHLQTRVSKRSDGSFVIKVRCAKPALWVWLTHKKYDLVFTDNFFDIRPGESYELWTAAPAGVSAADFENGLAVHSLIDTYSDEGTVGIK